MKMFRLFVAFTLACFALSPNARAVVPPPGGGYPNFTTAEGHNALQSLTTGVGNTGVGWYSLFNATTASFNTGAGAGTLALNGGDNNTATGTAALLLNATGSDNTAVGSVALLNNDDGTANTAVGSSALSSNSHGNSNTATGFSALKSTTTGSFNTAAGSFALTLNTTGSDNTAFGAGALENATTSGNTAVGSGALLFDTSGSGNTAVGGTALKSNVGGLSNTAIGGRALESNIDGGQNTASGLSALLHNTSGSGNVAVGYFALLENTTGIYNTAIGVDALNDNTGSNNIAVGAGAGGSVIAATNVTCIGSSGANVDNTTWIRNIYGITTQNGTTSPVIVSADGQLGTVASSERFKKDIATMEKSSEAILSLRPVTFHYKTDTTCMPQFGLIAEEVANIDPALVLPDKEGKPFTVRYDAVNAMLLNEFLKEHRKVEEQGSELQKQAAIIARQQKQIEELADGLRKVSAQLAPASPILADSN